MKHTQRLGFLIALIAAACVALWYFMRSGPNETIPEDTTPTISVAIAPYQDLAMLVNAEPEGIADKHGLQVKLLTVAWEDILPAIASQGKTADVGFGSYIEFLTKYAKLNDGSPDPIVFFQPLYVYKGGGFITLRKDIPTYSAEDLRSTEKIAALRRWSFGAQKESLYDMLLYSIAQRGAIAPSDLKVYDTPMNDALLALESQSLDMAAAGLTQVTEAQKRGGHLAIPMENAGFADVTGFICRKSTLDSRRADLEKLVLTWFDCVNYVMTNIKLNSKHSLDYLKANAATQYTQAEYENALSQEFLPRSIAELDSTILASGSKFDYRRIGEEVNGYLLGRAVISHASPIPSALVTGTKTVN